MIDQQTHEIAIESHRLDHSVLALPQFSNNNIPAADLERFVSDQENNSTLHESGQLNENNHLFQVSMLLDNDIFERVCDNFKKYVTQLVTQLRC